jgi:pimeloyl-ACP methyl ester carboxylesterase
LQYAGIYPDRVKRLVAIEGVSAPPGTQSRTARERLREWVEAIREYEQKSPRRYPSLEAACGRMLQANSHLSKETARHLTLFGSNWNADGTLTWKFDNFVRALTVFGFNMDDVRQTWTRIRCPVLLFRGADSWTEDPVREGYIRAIADHRLITVPNAGHWLHHDRPEFFIRESRKFLLRGLRTKRFS